ncbi:Hypothetical predicted protein [Paramuricea clavata]|uniref:Uncharacterized protein n=1 Tax=Paramuricea clavata TaxID=317549 RepID=A0A6S7IKW5_PARCT|nr:Hypothetical predicted protein [Paramuricea clavata]
MARQGQQLSPLPKQASIPSQEEEPARPALTTTTTFPAITQERTYDHIQTQAVEVEIETLLTKGVLVLTEHEKGEYISPIFTTAKKDGSARMILNLKSLNKFIEYKHFKMESSSTIVNMVKPNCFMASVDLKDAYYSVPIHPQHQKYLKFNWKGQLYKFTCFPNGLAFCPRKFTKLLKPINSYLRQLGHISVSHIDDSYLQGDDYDDCASNVLDTTKLFDSVGFVIHPDKSSLIPKQQMTILGVTINSVEMRVYPSKDKTNIFLRACSQAKLIQNAAPTIRQVASVLGLLVSNFPSAQFGPLHFRDLDMDKTEALKLNKGNFDKDMILSKASYDDWHWWVNSADSLFKPIGLSHVCVRIDNMTAVSDIGYPEHNSISLAKNSRGGEYRADCGLKLANPTLVAIFDAHGHPESSCSPKQQEDVTIAHQIRPCTPTVSKLTLLLCRVLGKPSKIKDYLKQLYLSYCHRGGRVHKDNTHHTLINGYSTVIQEKWI